MAPKKRWPPVVYEHRGRARARGLDGKMYYFGRFGSPEAAKKFSEWLIEQMDGQKKPVKAGLTVEDVCRQWFSAHQHKLKGVEAQNYEITARALIRTFGDRPADSFDCVCLEDMQQILVDGSWHNEEELAWYAKRGQPITLSRAVVNRRITRIKTIWRWAERRKLVPKGSYAELLTVRSLDHTCGAREGEGHHASTLEDVLLVAEHAVQPAGDMLLIQWWAGMRSGEVRIMRTVDIDTSGPIWVYRPGQHKNKWRGKGHDRVILLVPEAQKILQKHLLPENPTAYLFRPSGSTSDHYSVSYYTQAVARACEKAGVKVTPYGGRHAARDRIVALYGPEIARIFLGHKDLDTTQIYGARDISAALDAFQGKK